MVFSHRVVEAIVWDIPWTPSQTMDDKSMLYQNDLEGYFFSKRDSHRGEPDALTAPIKSNGGRFWEGATRDRLSPSFMLNLRERARSTHPKSPPVLY